MSHIPVHEHKQEELQVGYKYIFSYHVMNYEGYAPRDNTVVRGTVKDKHIEITTIHVQIQTELARRCHPNYIMLETNYHGMDIQRTETETVRLLLCDKNEDDFGS